MVDKITSPITSIELINKTNEIIDAIPTDTSDLSNGANFLVNNAADSTNGVAVKGSGRVQSTQIGALGSAASMSTSVGFSSYASGSQAISIGHSAQASASKSYAFGEQAKSTAIGAFQFGQATNSEAGSVYFGLTTDGSTTTNYKLLGSDGKIPTDRINVVTTISSSSTDAQIPSAKCVYDAIQSGGGGGGLSYSATCPAITLSSGIASWSITHNLGTQDVVAILYNSSGQENDKNVVINSNNQITVSWKASSNISAGDYKIVVLASGASSVNTFYDGQWVAANDVIVSNASTTGVDYDLSNYLPDDNYSYEILLYGQININVGSGNYRNLCVTSSILTSDYSICAIRQASSTIATTTGTVIMAIGTNRKLTVTERTGDKGNYKLWLRGYRRIGTNA